MSRVFWDSMLFIYLLENHPLYYGRVEFLLLRSRERGDELVTSHLVLGEILAGASKSGQTFVSDEIQETMSSMGFSYLPFDGGAVRPFAQLRSVERVKVADAINLACAASAKTDLFLTADKQIQRLFVPGIQFIADFNTPLL